VEGKIALEEHFALEETLEDSMYPDNFPAWSEIRRRLLDLDDVRLAEMDRHGIEFVILSLQSPAVQSVTDPQRATELARKANDVLKQVVSNRPDRFAGFAALPMQDPDAAIIELRRAVKDLGFKGAMVNGFSQIGDARTVVYLDDPRYSVFWATLEELDVPLYLHPRNPLPSREPVYDGHPWFMGSPWAFGVETAIHALRLMASGLFDRHPSLNIILGHLGEGLPYSVWRLDHRIRQRPCGIPAKREMAHYLGSNFYLTTSGNFRTPTLIDAIMEVSSDRILFSVDYPFETTLDAVDWFDHLHLSARDLLKIGRNNALSLFKLNGKAQAIAG
jgi:2,3-dihydroxybenzoate decarboxylase